MEKTLKEKIESLSEEERYEIIQNASINHETGVSIAVEAYCEAKMHPEKTTSANLGGKKL
jgi:hypothetical protein